MQAEAAAAAGESSFRSFMVAVQRCASSVAIVQQVYISSIFCFLQLLCTSGLSNKYLILIALTLTIFFPLQYFTNSISRLLLPVDGSHAASWEEMAAAMAKVEAAAYKGLQQCIETVMAEVMCCYSVDY